MARLGRTTTTRRRLGVAVVLLVAVLALAAVLVGLRAAGRDGPVSSWPGPQARPAAGVVTRVVDGDTLEVAGVGRVRVIGIDTPERGECGYEQAAADMAALVLGERVQLVPGARDDADRYGRLLRYVEVDGADAGLALLADGLAQARYDSRDGYGEHPRELVYVRADSAGGDVCAGPG
jgi:endonuclease YncB( thermonuclease family)